MSIESMPANDDSDESELEDALNEALDTYNHARELLDAADRPDKAALLEKLKTHRDALLRSLQDAHTLLRKLEELASREESDE